MHREFLAILVSVLAMTILSAYDFCPVSNEPVLGPVGQGKNLQTSSVVTPQREIQVVTPGWVPLMLGTLSLASLIASLMAFALYRARHDVSITPRPFVPTDGENVLIGIGEQVANLTDSLARGIGDSTRMTSENSDKLAHMLDTFTTLRTALDEKDDEIRRFKKGYDAEIFRRFLSRFIRVDQATRDFIAVGKVSDDQLRHLQRLLEDAFDECGIESFQPTVGDDYRTAPGIADNPKATPSKNPADAFKIAEVIEVGYRLRNGKGYEIIKPARVKIFLGTK